MPSSKSSKFKKRKYKDRNTAAITTFAVLVLAVATVQGCEDGTIPSPAKAIEQVANEAKNNAPAGAEIVESTIEKAQIATQRGLNKASESLANASAQANDFLTPDDESAVFAKDYGPYDIENCFVTRISDGDTATCLKDDKKTQVKIRFAQIDAPESKQEFGTVSKQALSNMIFNKNIDLVVEETDRYGRNVAEVFIDGVNVNKYMVKNGYAWAYKEYMKDKDYLRLQESAQNAKVGIWSHPKPIYPQDFRRQQAAARTASN